MTAPRAREQAGPPSPPAAARRVGGPSSQAVSEGSAAGVARLPGARRGLLRSARALAAAALLALTAALALPATAWAQDVVLVSNMAELSTGSVGVYPPGYVWAVEGFGVVNQGEVTQAQEFTTGANAEGYTLGSVVLNLRQALGEGQLPLVAIHRDNFGSPGTLLGVLNNPADPFGDSSLSAGNRTFTAASGLSLAAGTDYWVWLKDTGSTVGREHYTTSTANSADQAGAEGFSIADGRLQRDHTAPGEAWIPKMGIVRMEIRGTVKEAPDNGDSLPRDCTANASDEWCGVVTVASVELATVDYVGYHGGTGGMLSDSTFQLVDLQGDTSPTRSQASCSPRPGS